MSHSVIFRNDGVKPVLTIKKIFFAFAIDDRTGSKVKVFKHDFVMLAWLLGLF